jgi:hypothetical protein
MVELSAAVAVGLLTVSLGMVAARGARMAGWNAVDAENLHRFASGTAAYGADNGDRYWTFSWQKAKFDGEKLPSEYPDLQGRNGTDLEAAAAQAIDMLRRKSGREDIQYITSWVCHVYYSHLPLLDYLDQEAPALWSVCPADRMRLMWAKDPAAFDRGDFLPCQPTPLNANRRWPYSSSYELSTSFYDQSPVGDRVAQGETFNTYFVPGSSELFARLIGETAYPSQKVHLFEAAQHHIDEDTPGRCESGQAWYVPDSRIAALFADGHAGMVKTGEANRGWQPNKPAFPDPTLIGGYPGVYRWTREYLSGRDLGGPEVGPPP